MIIYLEGAGVLDVWLDWRTSCTITKQNCFGLVWILDSNDSIVWVTNANRNYNGATKWSTRILKQVQATWNCERLLWKKWVLKKEKRNSYRKLYFIPYPNKVRKFHLKRFPSQFMLANKNISLNYACYELAYCPLFVGIFHVPFSIGDI